ncbi:MAG: DUF1559 domain-containing protein [Planctomycetaceae bacterium]
MSEHQQPARPTDMSILLDRLKISRLLGWRQVLYAVAVLALSYAAFGPPLHRAYEILPRYDLNLMFFSAFYGLLPGVTVVLIWGLTWMWKSRPQALCFVGISLYVIVFIIGGLIPQPSVPRDAARRTQCKNNLKQIGLALHNYHSDFGAFPPAYVADENGRPMHSWRVLLLPYLDYQNVYNRYDFNEPWDGPSNQRLAEQPIPSYQCPSHHSEHRSATTYHVLVGAVTMWPGEKGVAIDEITDGIENTLAVVELNQREVNWMDPREITAEEFLQLYETPIDDDDLPHAGGTHTLYGDGGVRFVSWNMSPAYWRSLLTKAADDALPESAMADPERARRRSKSRWKDWRRAAHMYSPIAFIVLALLPLPWVWIRPRKRSWDGSGGALAAIAGCPASASAPRCVAANHANALFWLLSLDS